MSELGTSQHQEFTELDRKKYDAMDTDALKEILREDAEMPNSDKFGMDAILYIMEVVARREEEQGNAPDVHAAWESFKKNYYPFSDACTIGDTTSDIENHDPGKDTDTHPSVSSRPRSRSVKRILHVAAGVALVSVLLISANSLIADAFGFDIFRSVARWTQETFGFFSDKGGAETQLTTLKGYLEEYSSADSILPKYIPEGYEVSDILFNATDSHKTVCCALSNGENELILQYHIYPTELNARTYEMRDEAPEIYKEGGVEHCIMLNADRYTAAWISGNTECAIIGLTAREELVKMINSIYGG